MKRAIWFCMLALGGCGDPHVDFEDVQVEGDGVTTAGSASNGGTSGDTDTTGGTSPGGSMTSGGSVTAAGGTPSGGASATGGRPATGGAQASGGTHMNAGGSDAAAAGDTSGGAPPTVQENPLDLIDDMEGAFPKLPVRGGRDGAWFSAHDDSYGHLSGPNAIGLLPARGSSHVAAGLLGSGFTGWGAQLGVSLTSTDDGYDASAFCGVHFWAKGSSAGWTLLVSDRLSMPQGGVCNAYDFDGPNACYRFVGKGLPLSNAWQELSVGFADLRLVADPNSPRRLETAEIYGIVFNFYGEGGGAFDIQVDDLAFIKAGSPLCP